MAVFSEFDAGLAPLSFFAATGIAAKATAIATKANIFNVCFIESDYFGLSLTGIELSEKRFYHTVLLSVMTSKSCRKDSQNP